MRWTLGSLELLCSFLCEADIESLTKTKTRSHIVDRDDRVFLFATFPLCAAAACARRARLTGSDQLPNHSLRSTHTDTRLLHRDCCHLRIAGPFDHGIALKTHPSTYQPLYIAEYGRHPSSLAVTSASYLLTSLASQIYRRNGASQAEGRNKQPANRVPLRLYGHRPSQENPHSPGR